MIELIKPGFPIKTSIVLAGSKSISNRLLILEALLGTRLNFSNLSSSEDTRLLQKALNQVQEGTDPVIDIHHAGTDMRFLTAFLSVTKGTWTLTGSERMKQRPIGELVKALRILGADIRYIERDGFPPLQITGKQLSGGALEIDSSQSSQFISALLLISPALKNGLRLTLTGETVSYPYIGLTLQLLHVFGIGHRQDNNVLTVGPSEIKIPEPWFKIESDWSSASYWYSTCALSPGSEIELSLLSEKSLQADAILPALFDTLGVSTTFKENSILLVNKEFQHRDFRYDFTNCPDIAPTLAVTCFGLGIKAFLTGLKTLKIKESDRIQALKMELEALGAYVEAGDDAMIVEPGRKLPDKINPPVITYNDHRMAMSFAPLALSFGKIRIADPAVVVKSYPGFWEDLKSAGFSVNLQP